MNIEGIARATRLYNFHTHTQYCDGRASVREMAEAAREAGFRHLGFTPHSPVCCTSGCNMSRENVIPYMDECRRLSELYPDMRIYTGMEIDFIGRDFGPHIDYFRKLGLDYSIGSVHFVPTREGVPVDCDGSYERFAVRLKDAFRGDLRYVVERYFEQVLTMLELGGFEILGHFDKIGSNASQADPEIERQPWYVALIGDVISHAESSGVVVEVNTKAFEKQGRFFPSELWWPRLRKSRLTLVVDSDAHYTDKITAGRAEAFRRLSEAGFELPEE